MSWIIHHIRIIRRWHARLGMLAMLYLVFLVFSGWALNHGETLSLNAREITTPWLMRWYGISALPAESGYALGDSYLAWNGEKWALGNTRLANSSEPPVGAIALDELVYIASANTLSIYQADGQLLDKLDKSSLPAFPIIALGKAGARIALKTRSAEFFTTDGLNWEKGGAANIQWSATQTLPAELNRQLANILAPGLPLQRILQDVHSGRIFGQYGVFFVDLVGLALLTLGMSGLWIFWRAKFQGRVRK